MIGRLQDHPSWLIARRPDLAAIHGVLSEVRANFGGPRPTTQPLARQLGCMLRKPRSAARAAGSLLHAVAQDRTALPAPYWDVLTSRNFVATYRNLAHNGRDTAEALRATIELSMESAGIQLLLVAHLQRFGAVPVWLTAMPLHEVEAAAGGLLESECAGPIRTLARVLERHV